MECVPNFSEGRDASIVDRIAQAVADGSRVAVLHQTMDSDHNRSVLTFAGDPESVAAAALRAVRVAAELIDLNRHEGVHPRIGAADVVPFVPVEGVTLQECAELARSVGAEIWRTLSIPVYLYEAASRTPARQRLESIRRGGFAALREKSATDPERLPDIGGPALHPTAGACVVGARKFLIAFNVNLRTTNLEIAKDIAREIRASSGGFPHVKALGLPLASRGLSQVSINLTDFEETPLHVVFDAVKTKAEARGVSIAGSEIIGLIPRAAIEQAAAHYLQSESVFPGVVFENRLSQALSRQH